MTPKKYWKNRFKKLAYVNALKARPCMDCKGCFPPPVMEFDHRDPSTKVAGVGRLIQTAGLAKVKAEIAKCDLVCANCHRMRTWNRYERHYPI